MVAGDGYRRDCVCVTGNEQDTLRGLRWGDRLEGFLNIELANLWGSASLFSCLCCNYSAGSRRRFNILVQFHCHMVCGMGE